MIPDDDDEFASLALLPLSRLSPLRSKRERAKKERYNMT
jgi:hypothetical protein